MADDPKRDSDVTSDETGSDISFSPDGFDIIRFDPSKDIPVISSGPISAYEAYKKYQEEGDWAELTNIAAAAADLGINVVTYMADPLNSSSARVWASSSMSSSLWRMQWGW